MLKVADTDILEYWLELYNTIWTQEEFQKLTEWNNNQDSKGDLSL